MAHIYVPVTVPAASVAASLTDFPLYIDLASLPACFWTNLSHDDGRDIRVTDNDGDAIPFDLVSIDRANQGGALFLKTSLSNGADTTVRIYAGNAALSPVSVGASNGRNAVWSNYHRVFFFGAEEGWNDHAGNGTRPAISVNASSFEQTNISGETGCHQGVAFDGTYFYTFGTNLIRKWDQSWNLLAANTNPCGDVGDSTDHVGDGCVVDGILYLPIQTYSYPATFGNGHIAKFNTSDLSFISKKNIESEAFEIAGLCYVEEDRLLYAVSFVDGSKLWKYDIDDLAFRGTLTLSSSIPNAQSITFFRGRFFITSDGETAGGVDIDKSIIPVLKSGSVQGEVVVFEMDPLGSYDIEGIDHDDDTLYLLRSEGATSGEVWTFTPIDLQSNVGARFKTNGTTTDNGYALATGLTRYTTWTMGASASIRAKGAGSQGLVSYTQSGSTDDAKRVTMAWRQSTDRFGVWNQADSWLTATSAPTLDQRYRLHATYDGTTRREFFQNGVSQGVDLGITAMPHADANALYLGKSHAVADEFFDGVLGFVYIRNAILSDEWIAAEVSNLHAPESFYVCGPSCLSAAVPGYEITIGDEEDINPLLETFRIQEPLDGNVTLVCDVDSSGSPYTRFNLNDSVFVSEEGVRIFGGVVTGLRERALGGPNTGAIVVEVQATSYAINAKRRYLTQSSLAGSPSLTLREWLDSLIDDYLGDLGVTLHPDQVEGPALQAFAFERTQISQAISTVCESIGFLWSIDFENQLRAWQPGDIDAPEDIDEATTDAWTGDVEKEEQLSDGYANHVTIVGEGILVPDHLDEWTGDGAEDTFDLTYKIAGPYPDTPDGQNAVAFGVVRYPATGTTESIAGLNAPLGFIWEYDPINLTIRRRSGAPGNGVDFELPYHGLFEPNAVAEDAGEIASYGLWEYVEHVTSVPDDLSAQELADAILAKRLASKDEFVTYQTRDLGYHPGQFQQLECPSREVSGDYLITQVDTFAEPGSQVLVRRVRAAKSLNNDADWRKVYQQWFGVGASSSSATTSTTAESGAGAGLGLHASNHEAGGIDPINVEDLPAGSGSDGNVLTKSGDGSAWAAPASASGSLIGRQVITATGAGTYTPTSGTVSIVIELQGAGGGGGGIASPGASNFASGRGGGGGAYLRKRLTTAFSGASYSVGAKGTGGTAGNNAGNSGGNTTFTATGGGGTVYTAGGGVGGNGGAGVATPFVGAVAAGGTATNGDINIPGGASFNSIGLSATSAMGGRGGVSKFSPGAAPINTNTANTSGAGNAASGYGGGGSAGLGVGTGAAVAGGDGSDGILIVWEYS